MTDIPEREGGLQGGGVDGAVVDVDVLLDQARMIALQICKGMFLLEPFETARLGNRYGMRIHLLQPLHEGVDLRPLVIVPTEAELHLPARGTVEFLVVPLLHRSFPEQGGLNEDLLDLFLHHPLLDGLGRLAGVVPQPDVRVSACVARDMVEDDPCRGGDVELDRLRLDLRGGLRVGGRHVFCLLGVAGVQVCGGGRVARADRSCFQHI